MEVEGETRDRTDQLGLARMALGLGEDGLAAVEKVRLRSARRREARQLVQSAIVVVVAAVAVLGMEVDDGI